MQQAFYSATFMEHGGSAWQNQEPWGGHVFTHAHVNVHSDIRTPHARLLPSAAQPPTSRTTRRPMGPTTDTTPGPQAGAMLDRDLQPPTSTLEGDGPRSLTESPQAERQTGQRLQRQQRGLERGGGESGKPSWGRQWEDHRGVEESHRTGARDKGPWGRVMA